MVASGLISVSSQGQLVKYATDIYIKTGLNVGSYVANNYTADSEPTSGGFVHYVKNS